MGVRTRLREERAQATVEMAMVTPVLLVLALIVYNIMIFAGAVARFDRDGGLDEVVELPAGFVSSICFGGADMCDVLITTADNRVQPELGGTLLRARSAVAGLRVYAARV